jgi:hypothetical protein
MVRGDHAGADSVAMFLIPDTPTPSALVSSNGPKTISTSPLKNYPIDSRHQGRLCVAATPVTPLEIPTLRTFQGAASQRCYSDSLGP